MQELIQTFHLSVSAIIAQMVNLGIVVFILSFGLKPILKVMNERTVKIEKSLSDAKLVEERLLKNEEERSRKLEEVQMESQRLLEEARDLAERNRADILAKTKKEVEEIVLKTKERLSAEKELMLTEVKKEATELIITATKTVLEKLVDKNLDEKIIDKSLKDAVKKLNEN